MGFASKTVENIDVLFSKRSLTKKRGKKQRNLPKIMLGTSRKIKERSYMLYQRKREHASLLVQLAQLNVGLSSYPFTCQ